MTISEPDISSSPVDADNNPQRRIRSFTLRQGRLTEAQSKALDSLWPIYGLEANQSLDIPAIFGREAPVVIEIGFGNGETLAHMAAAAPDTNFVGIEVHGPGVGQLLWRLQEKGLHNVRVYRADAVEILTRQVADASLNGVHVFFPDPWPKKRHHKRRLINPEFMQLVMRKLKQGGIFHAATDWEHYAQHMLAVLGACEELENTGLEDGYAPRPAHRPLTKFESRGQRLGHGVWDLIFTRR